MITSLLLSCEREKVPNLLKIEVKKQAVYDKSYGSNFFVIFMWITG